MQTSDQLDRLVNEAQNLVRGIEPQTLRANETLRQHVATQLSRVQSVLDGMMIDRPRRNIIRNQIRRGFNTNSFLLNLFKRVQEKPGRIEEIQGECLATAEAERRIQEKGHVRASRLDPSLDPG